mgnify:CR=1 FL=1
MKRSQRSDDALRERVSKKRRSNYRYKWGERGDLEFGRFVLKREIRSSAEHKFYWSESERESDVKSIILKRIKRLTHLVFFDALGFERKEWQCARVWKVGSKGL